MCEVYLVPLSACLPAELSATLLGRLQPDERARILRLRSPSARQRSLCGRLLARALLCERLGLENDMLRFAAGERGKPFLPGHPGAGFSISHTEHCVAVAVGDGGAGVDVEGSRRACPRVAERCFTRNEARFLYSAGDGWERRFFYVWTRKEACVKYTGAGLSTPLSSFDVLRGGYAQWLRSFVHGGYTVSVCADTPPDTLRVLAEESLLNMAMALSPYAGQC